MTHGNYKLHKNKTLDTENAFPSRGTSCRSRTLLHANTKRPSLTSALLVSNVSLKPAQTNPRARSHSVSRAVHPLHRAAVDSPVSVRQEHPYTLPDHQGKGALRIRPHAQTRLSHPRESLHGLISNCQNKWGWGYDFKGRVCSVMPCTIMGTGASRSRVSPGMARASLVARLSMRQRLRWSAGVSACYAK